MPALKRISWISMLVRSVAMICVMSAILLCRPITAQADIDVENVSPEYAEALEQFNQLSSEYSQLAAEQSDTLSKLEDVQEEIRRNDEQADELRKTIAEKQTELSTQQSVLATHVSSNYKIGLPNLITLLLSSTSFEDAISRIYYYNSICDAELDAISAINATKAELQDKENELERLTDQLKGKADDLEILYDQQTKQAEEMHLRQTEASAVLSDIPKEIQKTVLQDDSELAGATEMVERSEDADNEESDQSHDASEDEEKVSALEQHAPRTSSREIVQGEKGTLQAVFVAAYSDYPTSESAARGWGCAGYIYFLFQMAGINAPTYDAAHYCENYCFSSDRSALQPGMIIGVTTHTRSAAGSIHGHVGLYIGNNTVRDFGTSGVQETPLDAWISFYGTTVTPRWGWYGGIALS